MRRHGSGAFILLSAATAVIAASALARAAQIEAAPPLAVHRAEGPIVVDGDLSDPGWRGALRVDTWYEVNPGDNVPPQVGSRAYLAYDDRFFYVAFELQDPDPSRIRAAYADHDGISGDQDFAGVLLDTRHDGKSAVEFFANPHGIEYDAVQDDTLGNEDSSPDYFWDAAGRITKSGWSLEIRIPFSSLRYPRADPATWGILLYRNYPREYRYQLFNTRLPRGGQCFVCRATPLTGLQGLPSAGHLVVAPYANGNRTSTPAGESLGAPLKGALKGDAGVDVKWTPGANAAVDATFNPDFSQIESDVAQISANERFALFYPEKRPFFLEDVELFTTPLQAVYTRTITSPRWGLRATGKRGGTAFTALVAQDRGGGEVVVPGAVSSDLAEQDFQSVVGIARVRRDLGRSYLSALATVREIQGGGHNRVFGPDFQWRRGDVDTITGQVLWSDTRTPLLPDLAEEWDGRHLRGHAADLWWSHSTTHVDLFTEIKDLSRGFRADDGFVPEVGYRNAGGEYGYTFRPHGLVRRLRLFLNFAYSEDADGRVLERQGSFGVGIDARWNTSARLRYAFDHVRSGDRLLPQRQLLLSISTSPSRLLSGIHLEGSIGQQIDFDNHQSGTGPNLSLAFVLRPTAHLELRVNEARRWLDLERAGGGHRRLFRARVDRLRATYTFTSRAFLRAIGQWTETRRDPVLYADEVAAREGALTGSLLFAYKLNWQTVFFLGYGDLRELNEAGRLEKSERQLFVKVSYAWQR